LADNFVSYQKGLESPADVHTAVTFDVDIDPKPRALRFNAAGTVSIQDAAGTSRSYTVAAGEVLPFRAKRVNSSGTSGVVAGDITAWS
jgi:hypothetical protein